MIRRGRQVGPCDGYRNCFFGEMLQIQSPTLTRLICFNSQADLKDFAVSKHHQTWTCFEPPPRKLSSWRHRISSPDLPMGFCFWFFWRLRQKASDQRQIGVHSYYWSSWGNWSKARSRSSMTACWRAADGGWRNYLDESACLWAMNEILPKLCNSKVTKNGN